MTQGIMGQIPGFENPQQRQPVMESKEKASQVNGADASVKPAPKKPQGKTFQEHVETSHNKPAPKPKSPTATAASKPIEKPHEPTRQAPPVVRPKVKAPVSPERSLATAVGSVQTKATPSVKTSDHTEEINTVAAAAATLAPTVMTKQDHLALASVLGHGPEVLQNSPVLAFLSGKLELLNPAEIPSLVGRSSFVGEALTQQNIGDFLSADQPVSQLLEQFGFPASVQDKISELGISPDTKTSPKRLLASLGVDPTAVFAELEMLRDNLQLEGFKPYLERAARLATDARKGNSAPVPTPVVANSPITRNPGTPFAGMPTPEIARPLAPVKTDVASTGVDPFAQPMLADQPRQVGVESSQNDAMKSPATPMNQYAGMANAPVPVASMSGFSAQPNNNLKPSAPKPEVSAVGMKTEPPQLGELTPERLQAFEQNFANADIQRLDMNSLSAPEMLLNQKISENGDVTQMSVEQKPEVTSNFRIPDQNLTTDSAGKTFEGIQNPGGLITGNFEDPSGANPAKLDISANIERMMAQQIHADSRVSAVGNESRFADSRGGGEGLDFGARQGGESSTLAQPIIAPSMSAPKFDQVLRSEVHAPAIAADHVNEMITDKAQMLLKEGGGSVLMDLGNKEIGRLEIALDVRHDSVGLKILAASDQVREALSADMGRLREALSSHNLDLRQVDLGAQREGAWQFGQSFQNQNAFAQNQFGQSSGQRSDRWNANIGVNRAVSNFTRPNIAMAARHNGQIQVLI